MPPAHRKPTAAQGKAIPESTADKIVDTATDPMTGHVLGRYHRRDWSLRFGYGKVDAAKAVGLAVRLR